MKIVISPKQPFSDVLHKDNYSDTYLCLKMIDFDAVDFTKHIKKKIVFACEFSVIIRRPKMKK